MEIAALRCKHRFAVALSAFSLLAGPGIGPRPCWYLSHLQPEMLTTWNKERLERSHTLLDESL